VKLSIHKRIRRRDLLKTLGGAALALPALELFEWEARAQSATKTSKFIVFCYTPDGTNQAQFWPTGTTTNYTLSSILQPFEKYKDKLLILGPQMNGTSVVGNTGLTYNAGPLQHQATVTLTGRSPNLPYTNPQSAAVNNIDGPSIDQVIAKAVKGDSTFASLNFGLHPIGGDTPSDFNYQEDGTPVHRLSGADEAWSFMFGNLMPTAGGGMTAQNKLNAVTTFLHGRFSALRPQLSSADRITLDAHLAAMQTYETRAKQRLATTTPGSNADCTSPKRATVATDADSQRTGADTQTLCPFFMDLITAAFECNLSKVASVTFGYPGGGDAGGLRMPWLGFTDPRHFVSHHNGNPDLLSKYAKMDNWIASQIAGLMDRLAMHPSPSGTGTLLDDTTIYWFNRHGDGSSHSNQNLPNVILGGTGGYFKMGRWLQLPTTSPTKVLISSANAMGVNVPSFGTGAFKDTAPLSGLT